MKFDYDLVSKQVGFYRKHHRVPTFEDVDRAVEAAKNGNVDGAIRLFEWKRHCFYVNNEYEREVMRAVFEYCDQFIHTKTIVGGTK